MDNSTDEIAALIVSTANGNKPEMAGVSIPSPISMHMPSIAMKSKTLLAITLFSINLPNLLGFWELWYTLACEILEFETMRFEERNPISIFLQSNEYNANVPPAIKNSTKVKNLGTRWTQMQVTWG